MKTKIYAFFLLLSILFLKTTAQTNVSGFISSNTTWDLAGSPYIVTGNILVDSGYSLTIDPGVIVKFNSAKSMQISGVINAVGTAANMITFTSNQPSPAMDDWDYIFLTDDAMDYDYTNDTGCVFKYCIIEYAGGAPVIYNAAIRIDANFPLISDCIIRHNGASGINGSTNDPGNGTLKILNCEIYDNDGIIEGGNCLSAGITIALNTSLAIVEGNYIHDNINNGQAAAIYLASPNNYGWSVSGNRLINNTNLSFYGGGAVYCTNMGTVSNNVIYGNEGAYGGALYAEDCRSSGLVTNNIIASNYATNSGGGIYFSTSNFSNPSILIKNNHIIDNRSANTCGINIPSPTNGKVMYNTITRNASAGTPLVQQAVQTNPNSTTGGTRFYRNNLYGNSGTGTFYEFYNALPQAGGTVSADTCWWGTTNTSVINATIYDFFDDGTLAITDYTPIRTSPDTIAPVTPVTNVIKTDLGGGNIEVSWDANLDTDVAGYKIYWGNSTGYSFSNSINAGNVLTFTVTGISINDTIAVTAYDNLADGTDDQTDGNESWYTRAIGKPQISFTASAIEICAGDSIVFTDNTADAETWTWTFPGGNPTVSNSASPTVFYNTGGTYDVTLIVTNIAGADTLTQTAYVTVNVIPAVAFSGLDTMCSADGTLTLTGGSPAGGSYTGAGVNAGIFDPALTGAGSFIITYTYIDTNGCGTAQAQDTVVVNQTPAVSFGGSNTICEEDAPLVLSGGTPAGGTYSGTGVTAGSFDPAVAGTGTFVITYDYTDANGCSAQAQGTVLVNPTPVVSFGGLDTICQEDAPLVLSGGTPAGGTYSGTAVTGGSFDPAAAGTGSFVITYDYTDVNGCSAQAQDTLLVDICTGLRGTALSSQMNVLPNPSSGNFEIKFANDSKAGDKIEVYTIAGQLVYTNSIPAGIRSQNLILNVEPGIYFLRMNNAVVRIEITK